MQIPREAKERLKREFQAGVDMANYFRQWSTGELTKKVRTAPSPRARAIIRAILHSRIKPIERMPARPEHRIPVKPGVRA